MFGRKGIRALAGGMRRVAGVGVTNIPGLTPLGGGMGQNTVAAQTLSAITRNGGTIRRAAPKRRKRAAPRMARKRKRKAGRARLVKGSAAAKRYMASIRRKRKR